MTDSKTPLRESGFGPEIKDRFSARLETTYGIPRDQIIIEETDINAVLSDIEGKPGEVKEEVHIFDKFDQKDRPWYSLERYAESVISLFRDFMDISQEKEGESDIFEVDDVAEYLQGYTEGMEVVDVVQAQNNIDEKIIAYKVLAVDQELRSRRQFPSGEIHEVPSVAPIDVIGIDATGDIGVFAQYYDTLALETYQEPDEDN